MDRFILKDIKSEEFNQITNEEIKILFLEGTKEAKEKIFKANLKLIKYVLSKINLNTLVKEEDYEDAFQEGALGLIEAINNYDSNYGTSFSTYAIPIIEGKIRIFSREKKKIIRPSRSAINLQNSINYISEIYYKNKGLPISEDTISNLLNISVDDINKKLLGLNTISLENMVINNEKPVSLKAMISETKDEILSVEIKMIIEKVLNEFNDDKKQAIKLYYIDEYEQTKIAKICNMSQAHVSRTIIKFKNKLKEELNYNPKFVDSSKMFNTNDTIYDVTNNYDRNLVDETIDEIFSDKEKEILLAYYPKYGKRKSSRTLCARAKPLLEKLILRLATKVIESNKIIIKELVKNK